MEKNITMERDVQIDALLTSWAVKYDVSTENHKEIAKKVRPLLARLYEKVNIGEIPSWLLGQEGSYKDSFEFALASAESSYERMVKTNKNLMILKQGLQDIIHTRAFYPEFFLK